jgi:hypothetical protein
LHAIHRQQRLRTQTARRPKGIVSLSSVIQSVVAVGVVATTPLSPLALTHIKHAHDGPLGHRAVITVRRSDPFILSNAVNGLCTAVMLAIALCVCLAPQSYMHSKIGECNAKIYLHTTLASAGLQ